MGMTIIRSIVLFIVNNISKRMCLTLAIESSSILKRKTLKNWPISLKSTIATKVLIYVKISST